MAKEKKYVSLEEFAILPEEFLPDPTDKAIQAIVKRNLAMDLLRETFTRKQGLIDREEELHKARSYRAELQDCEGRIQRLQALIQRCNAQIEAYDKLNA